MGLDQVFFNKALQCLTDQVEMKSMDPLWTPYYIDPPSGPKVGLEVLDWALQFITYIIKHVPLITLRKSLLLLVHTTLSNGTLDFLMQMFLQPDLHHED